MSARGADVRAAAAGRRAGSVGAMLALLALLLVQGCAALPPLDARVPSRAVPDTADTRLGRAATPLVDAHPGQSGVFPLRVGGDAFAARVLLADAAERTLDVQYYIWRADMSGRLLLDALRRAAARGVRVRMLLDDNNTSGLDAGVGAFAALANVEVRLFNPFAARGWRAFGFVTDFARLNRRMHNKSFTADNQATIVGGRNVGDEYFGAASDLAFFDLDLLAIGPVVRDVSEDFDRYWNSASAYPAALLLPPATRDAEEAFAQRLLAQREDPAAVRYELALTRSTFVSDLVAHRLAFEWARVQLVSDDPAKALGEAADSELFWKRLVRIVARPRFEFTLSSPYFVPGASGVDEFAAMAAAGVRITVLTNSLEATDQPAVHAGYAKRRVALLRAGVALYELKRGDDARPGGAASPTPSSASAGGSQSHGSSGSSLHAKAFTVDGGHVFVGSFNYDQRSANLNTEMGFVIDSPALVRSMQAALHQRLTQNAYRVRLSDRGTLQWIDRVDGHEIVHDVEPGTTFWSRFGISLLSLLPIDWLL